MAELVALATNSASFILPRNQGNLGYLLASSKRLLISSQFTVFHQAAR
jgi:hypothetical protein